MTVILECPEKKKKNQKKKINKEKKIRTNTTKSTANRTSIPIESNQIEPAWVVCHYGGRKSL